MLDAVCLAKLATWACKAAAAALKAHDGDVEFFALLADLGGSTIEAGHALHDRPREVLRQGADRLATRIRRDHAAWLTHEFGSDVSGRQDTQAALAALPDVIDKFLPSGLDFARADLNATRVADEAVKAAGADAQFRAGTFGGRVLHALVAGAFAAARNDDAFARDMRLAIDQVLLERTSAAAASDVRQEASLQRIEAALQVGTDKLEPLRLHRLRPPIKTPNDLLKADRRATELVGRSEEMQPLHHWLTTPREGRDISVHCLVGQAGAGKTRLAIDLCEWAEDHGWTAGFVPQEKLQRFAEHHEPSDWRWPRPTLLVVDYAAASVRVLRSVLGELARGGRSPAGEPPLRVLLLERHASPDAGWWAELRQPTTHSGDGADSLIDPGAPLRLGKLRDTGHRRALLAEAMRLAAPLLHKPPALLPPPGADPAFDRRLAGDAIETEPLFLLMAGIVAVETGAPAALAMNRLDLAAWLAAVERTRLQRRAHSIGADEELVPYLAACVTLQGGCDADAAAALVTQEREAFGDRPPPPDGRIVALLRDALAPAEGDGIDAIRPDLIGEAFLLEELGREHRPLAQQLAIVERAFARAGLSVVATVIRTAQDYALGEASHRSVAWLDHLAKLTDDPLALMAIAAELPEQTLALREGAAEIQGRIVDTLAGRAGTDPDVLPLLAAARAVLGNRLSDLGEREAALAAAREAAELYRALAAQRPDAFRPDLAMSLNNLAAMLSDLGEREAALAAAREAVEIRRALAAQRPDAFRPDLAASLNNLAAMLSDLGEREAALAAAREAAELYRALAAQRPDAFRPDLAMSLNNLANMLSALGEREAALAAAREAVDIRRALAAQRPDAFRPDLAASLNNLANRLSALGEREAALAAAREAVDIRRALAAQRPDAFRPDLAASLNNLANRLSALGEREAALAAAREAVDIRRALAAQRPDAFRPDLAMSLNNLANRLSDLGEREAALAAAREAVDIRRALAAQRPDAFRPNLATSLMVQAACLDATDQPEPALADNVEAIGLLTPMFVRLPQAFAPLMAAVARGYLRRCEKHGREPDQALLAPVVAAFDQLPGRQDAAS